MIYKTYTTSSYNESLNQRKSCDCTKKALFFLGGGVGGENVFLCRVLSVISETLFISTDLQKLCKCKMGSTGNFNSLHGCCKVVHISTVCIKNH